MSFEFCDFFRIPIGTAASVECAFNYKLNLNKLATKAYCKCDTNNKCGWKFNKEGARCVYCPYERIQGTV